MVLNHILYHSGFFIKSSSRSNPYMFTGSYLNTVNKISVPDRLKPRVRKPEYKHVLDSLLPKKMINPVNLFLLHYTVYFLVQFYCCNPAVPKRFFNYNSSPSDFFSFSK